MLLLNVVELIELCKGVRSNQLLQINIANSQSEFHNVVLFPHKHIDISNKFKLEYLILFDLLI